MKIYYLLALLCAGIVCHAQNFSTPKDTIISASNVFSFDIKMDKNNQYYKSDYKVSAEIDFSESTLYKGCATLFYEPTDLTKNEGKQAFLLRMDNDEYKNRINKIVLKVTLKSSDGTIVKDSEEKVLIIIKDSQVQQFKYLAYIGTNFDLVDGIKAKNLFFATNVFLPPSEDWDMGVYISLYGNRTMTFKDSVGDFRRTYQVGLDTVSNTYFKIEESSNKVSTIISDNIGAYFSPLLKIGFPKFFDSKIKIFFSPSLEFLWRRTSTTITYSNRRNLEPVALDSQYNGNITYVLPPSQVLASNTYDLNMGVLGFFMSHENESISIRLHMNVGFLRRFMTSNSRGLVSRSGEPLNYFRDESDHFFSGKLWITERYSGITLQAEIINYSHRPNPFFGVTLSKALDFGKIGTIFSPLSRTTGK